MILFISNPKENKHQAVIKYLLRNYTRFSAFEISDKKKFLHFRREESVGKLNIL